MRRLKAMADPTRRRFFGCWGGEMTAGEISAAFISRDRRCSSSQRAESGADLIAGAERATDRHTLNTTVVQDLMTIFLDLFSSKSRSEP